MADLDNGVHKLPFSEIKKLDGFKQCVEEYKLCCVNPDVKPETDFDWTWYEKSLAALDCFVVIHDGRCVGFCSVVCSYYPHLNVNFIGTESLFIQSKYRGKYWDKLLSTIKQFGKEKNCSGVMIGAGSGTRFEQYMKLKYPSVNTLFWVKIDDK